MIPKNQLDERHYSFFKSECKKREASQQLDLHAQTSLYRSRRQTGRQDGWRIESWREMKLYLFLLAAIAFEVLGTMLLPASKNFTKLLPSAILTFSYLFSFYCLSLTVGKLPLSLVYSTWAGLGVFTVTLLSYFIYHQKISWQMVIGLFLIVTGVVIVNIYKSETQLTVN